MPETSPFNPDVLTSSRLGSDVSLAATGRTDAARPTVRLLLIDDDLVDRMAVRRLLRDESAAVELIEAGDVRSASQIIGASRIDCVLTDHHLPDGDATDILRSCAEVAPVVVMTGSGSERLAVELMKAGAIDYLGKSDLTADLLSRTIHSAIRIFRAEASAAASTARLAESERRFRVMADHAPVLIWVCDQSGRFEYFNQSWLDFTGCSTRTSLVDGWDQQIHPDDRTAYRHTLHDAFARQDAFSIEYRLRCRNGEYRWMLDHGVPRRDQDGAFIGFVGSCTDITRHRQIEIDMRQTNRALRAIIESSPLPIYSVDRDGIVLMWNPAAQRVFGWTAEQAIGNPLPIVGPDHLAEFESLRQRVWEGHPVLNHETVRLRSDGTEVQLSLCIAPLRDADGRVNAVLGIADDITTRKKAEGERLRLLLRERLARAEAEASRRRLAFLAEASSLLASSLDYADTRSASAALCVPRLGDFCVIYTREPDGRVVPLSDVHGSPRRAQIVREIDQAYPRSLADTTPVISAMREARSVLISALDEAQLREMARDERHYRLLSGLALQSMMVVPILARGAVLGAIVLASGESGRVFSEVDVRLVEEVARRAGSAVDNAQLYREAQNALAAQRQALADRERAAALLDTLFRSSPTGLCFLDNALCFQRINDSLAAVNGITPQAHIGRHVSEIVPQLWEQLEPYLNRLVETGLPLVDHEVTGVTGVAPHERRTWLTSWYPVRIASGDVLGIGVVVTDITDRRRREDELKLARDAAQNASDAKDQFLAVLSHELRTPLTPVLVAVQALAHETPPDSPLRGELEMIRRNVELEARLIDDLLDLTRIARGKLDLNLETTDALVHLRNTIDICRPDITRQQLSLSVETAIDSAWIAADAARLQQILWNLLKNAIKFTPAGGSLTVSAEPIDLSDDDQPPTPAVRITVKDSGIGIDREVLPLIFNAFEQGERAITRQFGGLGLGLAISKALADLHGARLTAHSEGPGQGARFDLVLPLVPAPSADEQVDPPNSEQPGSSAVVRILLVDDHVDTNRAMQRLLRRLGYQVTPAHSVAEAIDRAGAETFDLIVSDIGLPDGTGIDLMNALRASVGSVPRAIALSGFGMEQDVKRSLDAGFIEHLTKPVNVQKLADTIRKLVE